MIEMAVCTYSNYLSTQFNMNVISKVPFHPYIFGQVMRNKPGRKCQQIITHNVQSVNRFTMHPENDKLSSTHNLVYKKQKDLAVISTQTGNHQELPELQAVWKSEKVIANHFDTVAPKKKKKTPEHAIESQRDKLN